MHRQVYRGDVTIFRYKDLVERALVVFDHAVVSSPADLLARVRRRDFDPRQQVLLEETPAPATLGPVAATQSASATARFARYEPDRVDIEVTTPRPGFLLLLDTYFPGWEAKLDGHGTRILRADYNFRAVQVPAGRSTVVFEYRPASLRVGLALTAFAVVLLGAAFLNSTRRRKLRALTTPGG